MDIHDIYVAKKYPRIPWTNVYTCMMFQMILLLSSVRDADAEDYCLLDTFYGECLNSEVIMINDARYGAMEIGKCIAETVVPGYIGCSISAISFLDKACSGKQSCQFTIPGKELMATSPCPRGVSSYLSVTYDCISVTSLDHSICDKEGVIRLKKQNGYISNAQLQNSVYGTRSCPLMLQALAGQHISVSLINFNHGATSDNENEEPIGVIVDIKSSRNINIYHTNARITHLYQSSGEGIKLHFSASTDLFLIHYEVHGCANLVAPDHAWFRRSGDIGIIGCEYQNKTWHLVCKKNRWTGVVGSCNVTGALQKNDIGNNQEWFNLPTVLGFPMEYIITAVVGIVLLIFICSCLCILQKTISTQRRQTQTSEPSMGMDTDNSSTGYASAKAHTRTSWTCTYKSGKEVHTHIWETPLPEPSASPDTEYMVPSTMRQKAEQEAEQEYTLPTNMRQSQAYDHPENMNKTNKALGVYAQERIDQPFQESFNDDTTNKKHDNNDLTVNAAIYCNSDMPTLPRMIPNKEDTSTEVSEDECDSRNIDSDKVVNKSCDYSTLVRAGQLNVL